MSPGRSQSSVVSVTDTVEALSLAARGATEVRQYRLADLPRLTDLAVDEHAQAHLSARFHLVDERVGIIGRTTANLKLVCQRCLGSVQVPVDDEFHVVLVDSEDEISELPEEQDAVIAPAMRLELSWLLEEQLLLALPLVPTHASADECMQSQAASVSDVAEDNGLAVTNSSRGGARETQRPFANLRELLNADVDAASEQSRSGPAKKR